MLSLVKELLAYFSMRKKWWLLPVMAILLVFGGLLLLAQGSAIAPFIYTVFRANLGLAGRAWVATPSARAFGSNRHAHLGNLGVLS
jgi:hypothetical protein